jgi:hypothetical protein
VTRNLHQVAFLNPTAQSAEKPLISHQFCGLRMRVCDKSVEVIGLAPQSVAIEPDVRIHAFSERDRRHYLPRSSG